MWTKEQEKEYQETLARMNGLKSERDRAETTVKNAVAQFVRLGMGYHAGSVEGGIVERAIFTHRESLKEFLATLPALEKE